MGKIKLIVFVAVAATIGGFVWYQFFRVTPEQQEARWNLAALDAIEATWKEHDPRSRAAFFDADPFRNCAARLREVDMVSVADDVKAIQQRYIKFCEAAPELLRQFQASPPDAPAGNAALQQRAAEDKLLDIRNMGIQLELLLRGIDDEIAKTRKHYTRRANR